MKILLVCFANTCRSPVAEVLLRRAMSDDDVEIVSRGIAGGVGEIPESLIVALDKANLAITSPTGSRLARDDARDADIVLFMERRLLRDAVVADPQIWPKSFTLREFGRRGFQNPAIDTEETFEQWLALLHSGRNREELLGTDERDDISDPGLKGTEEQFDEMIASMQIDIARVAPLLSGWSTTEG